MKIIAEPLDLNKELIKNPISTFYVRVSGDSMIGAGIHNDDILIVDKSIEAIDKKVVIAVVDGDFTVKRFREIDGNVSLVPENDKYPEVDLSSSEVEIWGVVTFCVHEI
ncbi:MAG: translesion error-prone DNA polymerase V autoproteolytic subunit [Deltaproteobacteria bacterium]|nr:translesion error-prone DNA polymerase V autoproteolytic subunit [Deltaproteobacteria bacterium]